MTSFGDGPYFSVNAQGDVIGVDNVGPPGTRFLASSAVIGAGLANGTILAEDERNSDALWLASRVRVVVRGIRGTRYGQDFHLVLEIAPEEWYPR
jgi:hypothetical protein